MLNLATWFLVLFLMPGSMNVDCYSDVESATRCELIDSVESFCPDAFIDFKIKLDIGRPKRDCRGFGLCSIIITFFSTIEENGVLNSDGTLYLFDRVDEYSGTFGVEEDYTFSTSTSTNSSATILAGEYDLDRTGGVVIVDGQNRSYHGKINLNLQLEN